MASVSHSSTPPLASGGLRQRRALPLGAGASSRVEPPTDSKDANGDTPLDDSASTASKPAPASDTLRVPPEHAHRSPIAKLWLLSRMTEDDPPKYRNGGEDRPITLRNIYLALRLSRLIWRDVLRLFFSDQRSAMAMHFVAKIAKGAIPTCRIWASSAMLDLVQRSFEGDVSTAEVIRVAAMNLFFHAANDISGYLMQTNNLAVQYHIDYVFAKAHLRSSLSLSLPALSSPYASALLHESGTMAGVEYRIQSNGVMTHRNPFNTLDNGLLELSNILTQLLSQLYLLLVTVRSGGGDLWNWGSLLLILLSLGPSLLKTLASWTGAVADRRTLRKGLREVMNRHRAVKELGMNGDYKQEIVLFGLRDWVIEKWEAATLALQQAHMDRRYRMGVTQLGLNMGQEGVQTAFYVLLALKVLATNLSLGSIRLYQSTAKALIESIEEVGDVAEEVFQSIFFLAAYIEAMDLPEHPEKLYGVSHIPRPLVPYESTRTGDGMAIKAIDLGFTYPGGTKPTLRNINLSIAPGETLAIVGFNGGGKTTLVKALMGLYDHTGSLRINGVESREIDPASIHARTSCLFQDFSKFALSLRENIGVGAVEKIMEDVEIERAIERGDARQILDKVGLEGELNRRAVAKASEEEGSISAKPTPQVRLHGTPPAPSAQAGEKATAGKPTVLQKVTQALRLRERVSTPDSWLDERRDKASSLSGGQWQRVALARAFLRADEADLVVFDEPSAALDPKAEAELFQRIHALSRQNGRKTTTIYISHRFSTVRRADRIAVVEDGTITEQGTHTELMELHGRYFELYNLQAEGFIDEPPGPATRGEVGGEVHDE